MAKTLDNYDKDSYDVLRNIQNVRREGREVPHEFEVHSVETDFARKKSVRARAAKRKQREESEAARAEQLLQETEQEFVKGTAGQAQRDLSQTKRNIDQLGRKMIKKRGVSAFARLGGIGIAFKAYLWQALFGIISLIAFVAQSMVVAFKEDTFFGRVLGFFVDFEKYFPGEAIGLVFYGLATIVAVSTILAFQAWFTLTGGGSFKTIFGSIATYLLWAMSVLPVGNIFPTLLVWIIFVNLSSLSRKR